MKQRARYLLLLMVTAVALAAISAVAWIGGTAAGMRWLLQTISGHTSLKVSAATVEGRLLGRLRLTGVRASFPGKAAAIERAELAWQPLLLLAGEMNVRELVLRGVTLHDFSPPRPKKPMELAWPRPPRLASLFNLQISAFKVERFAYRRLDEKPTVLQEVSAFIGWRDGILTIDGITVAAPSGRITGNLSAAFSRPALKFDLSAVPVRPVAAVNRVSLGGRLAPGHGAEQLAGKVTATLSRAQAKIAVAAQVGMTRKLFKLKDLRVTGPIRGTLNGEGNISVAAPEPRIALALNVENFDLSSFLNRETSLTGSLRFDGTPTGYGGRLLLSNRGKGWQEARVASSFQGDTAGLTLAPLDIALLGGGIRGDLRVRWRPALSVSGSLNGRDLDPARVAKGWSGKINFQASGEAARSAGGVLAGGVRGELLESRLHGRALTGAVDAGFADGDVTVNRLLLRGKGFDVTAAGNLKRRLDFFAAISDFSLLIPGTAGELQAKGWVQRQPGSVTAEVSCRGRGLAADGIRIGGAEISARTEKGEGYPLSVSAALTDVVYGRLRADAATVKAAGTRTRHAAEASFRSSGAEAHLSLTGTYAKEGWRGEISRLSGRDRSGPWRLAAPADIEVTAARIAFSTLEITGAGAEKATVSGRIDRTPFRCVLRADWEQISLARAAPWLKGIDISGSSSGRIIADIPAEGQLSLSGSADAAGSVTAGDVALGIERSSVVAEAGAKGIRIGTGLRLRGGGVVKGGFTSSAPAVAAIPREGEINMEWSDIDLALFRSRLPAEANVEGRLSGSSRGKLLPGRRLEMQGTSSLSGAKVRWQREKGEVNLALRAAGASWNWREERLEGNATVALAGYGEAKGEFQLPLPARLPTTLNRSGPLRASLTGRVQEKGVLTSMFPGLVQESHGEVAFTLGAGGTWGDPLFSGTLALGNAGAYLPAAGIRLDNVQLTARLGKDLVKIESFGVSSGSGRIGGSADIRLQGWQVVGYSGKVDGSAFQVVHLPELQTLATPHLTFEGTTKKVTVRGDVIIPELHVYGPPARAPVSPSSDVIIIEEAPQPRKKGPAIAIYAQIRVILGEKILVKAEGLDARLGGSMELTIRGLNRITSKGEIKVVKGSYKAYGLDLEIVRGRVFYAGGALNQPTLDILALKTVGDVKAGVTVAGDPHAPVVKLYSEPTMPDVDVLAYLVLGHPLGNSTEQGALLARAATFLLSASQSVSLQDRIKSRLGLSTLEVTQEGGENAGLMGYKPIQAAPPGTAPSQTVGVSQTMVTIGKYLTPKLYISYGRSLFTGGNLLRLRYDIFRHWQIQTETGAESGADLYYKIDFD